MAGVRVATRCKDGLANSRSGDARGTLAGAADAARRSRRVRGERSCCPDTRFTPDSKAVVFTRDGHIQRVDLATRQVSTIPFNAKVDLDLGPRVHVDYAVDDGPLTVRQMRWTNQSPDGKRDCVQCGGKNLGDGFAGWQAAAADERSKGANTSRHFRRTGNGLHMSHGQTRMAANCGKFRAAGGNPVKISTIAGYYSSPQWSPDGSKAALRDGFAARLAFGGRRRRRNRSPAKSAGSLQMAARATRS